MYPPSADDNHCMMMSQIPVMTVKVVADAPEFDQGETVISPSPDPRARSTRDKPIAAKAPAKIGPQVTADFIPSPDVRFVVSIALALEDGAFIGILL
jgi:hypothetical protein